MRVLDLFAGIGGFSLAAHWMGWETAAFVEQDISCQRHLVILESFQPCLFGESLTSLPADSPVLHLADQESGAGLSKTTYSSNSCESQPSVAQGGSSLKTLKELPDGYRKLGQRSKHLATSTRMPFSMQEILESLKCEDVTLQCVFEEETALVHNIYGGFGEKKVRVFMEHCPTLRTPKGGGHLPLKLKTNGELSALTPSEGEMLMGYPEGWTE